MRSVEIPGNQKNLSGTLSFPGDKSLSHRAIIFGSLAEGVSEFTNVLEGEDCACTRKAFESMGVKIESTGPGALCIYGVGLRGLKAPKNELYLGNSGTSMRLLMGLLAGQPFSATLTGDASLSSRPMKRVVNPLRQMGARIEGKDGGNFAPITVHGTKLKGIDYTLPVASAQVKSAILLAGLYAAGTTRVTEPVKSRDHTENFLKYFGAKINENGNSVSIQGGQKLSAREFSIAGDISGAAFFMVMAALVSKSKIDFKNVLWNKTRKGLWDVFIRAGIGVGQTKLSVDVTGTEHAADFSIATSSLKAFEIKKEELPSLIDEIPILCVLATQAEGKSVIHDADELRVKETDRIESMVTGLSKMGAKIRAERNTILIEGPTPLHGAEVDSFKDHRTAMSLVVAGLIADGRTTVRDVDCIRTSFPDFFELLSKIGADFAG